MIIMLGIKGPGLRTFSFLTNPILHPGNPLSIYSGNLVAVCINFKIKCSFSNRSIVLKAVKVDENQLVILWHRRWNNTCTKT